MQSANAEEKVQTIPLALVVSTGTAATIKAGGLTSVERWVKALQESGVSQVEIVSPDGLGERLAEMDSNIILASGEWLVEPLALERLAQSEMEKEGAGFVVMTHPSLGAAPVMAFSAEAAGIVSELGYSADDGPDKLFELLEKDKRLDKREIAFEEAYWGRVTDETSADEAVWGLLKRLQFRPGGLVAKYINRPVSIRISRRIIDSPITPNMTTFAAFLIGLLGVYFIFEGNYFLTVLGALLLQANSVLDGIDGEIARIRHETSEFGAYFDSVCDEILNALLFIAIGYNLFINDYGLVYLFLGIFTGIVVFSYAAVHWHCKYKHGLGFYWWFEAYKPRKDVQRSTSILSYLKKLFWKESYLFLFIFIAIFQVMDVMLWIFGIASLAVVLLFIIHIPIKKARW